MGRRLRGRSCLTYPEGQLSRAKMVIATVDGRGGSPILEVEVSGVAPHHRTVRIPQARHGPDAPHHTASESPQNIELVRPLPPGDPTTQAGVEFFGSPGPVQPVAEVPVVQHAQPAQLPTLDELPDL